MKMGMKKETTGPWLPKTVYVSQAEYKRIAALKKEKRAKRRTKRRSHLPTVHELKLRLREICHEYIRLRGKWRTGGNCERCSVRAIYSANHILSTNDYPPIQFDEDNIFAGCNGCNINEMRHRQREMAYWRERLGPEKFDALEKRGREIMKWERGWLMDKIKYYEQKISDLTAVQTGAGLTVDNFKDSRLETGLDNDGREAC